MANGAGTRAIKSALANIEDNLYRYRHFMAPLTVAANGEKREEIISKLEAERDELRAALSVIEFADAFTPPDPFSRKV